MIDLFHREKKLETMLPTLYFLRKIYERMYVFDLEKKNVKVTCSLSLRFGRPVDEQVVAIERCFPLFCSPSNGT